ncbi:MAG: hypothetical protein AAGG68_08000 [Bacteroidota bacterium]
MKNLNLNFIALFAFVALLFTACEEDIIDPGTGGGDGTPPSIALVDEAGFIAADGEIDLGQPLRFKVSATKGSADLKTLTVFEDGSTIPLERISLSANPALFVGANTGGQTLEIEVTPDDKEGVYTYAFEVEDEEGEIATASVVVTTIIPFTAIDADITGALLNQGGAAGTGGLDLDAGEGTGSNDDAAEIQDEGIDLDQTAANNWRQQISGANDAEVVFIDDLGNVVEGLTFEAVEFKEQITDAFAIGAALDGDDSNCNCSDSTNGEAVSQPVQVGDIFAVKRGDVTYLLLCTAVNVVPDGNTDSYEFSIKY